MAKRIAVILTEEEYEQVKALAGLVPLSAYFRSLALKPDRGILAGDGTTAQTVRPARGVHLAQRSASAQERIAEPATAGARSRTLEVKPAASVSEFQGSSEHHPRCSCAVCRPAVIKK